MTFDALAIAALAAEIETALAGGRVQHLTQINSLTYGLEIFVHPNRHYLILSVEPQAPRLHLTPAKTRRGVGADTPLMLVLRKYLRGARLRRLTQPAYERLLYFDFDTSFGPVVLALELLDTRSNLILLDAHRTILGAARLTKPDEAGRRRTILPGQAYQPPPPQDKLTPPELTGAALRRELVEASPDLPLMRLLPGIVRGVSPLLAREIVYRVTGHVDTPAARLTNPDALLTVFHQLLDSLQTGPAQPALAFDDDGDPAAFAPYPLTHLPALRPVQTFSEAVETYFAETAAGYAAAKSPLLQAITDARQRLARRRDRLAEDASAQANPTALKEKGETILACAHLIKPGQTELTVDWLAGESATKIALDPAMSAAENAQHYFSRYRKAQRAADEIPAQFEKIELEESYLAQLEQDLEMAENRPEIDAVAVALAEAGFGRVQAGRKKAAKSAVSGYLRLTAPAGAMVWVGKNALQNAHLTFSRAAPDDLWLHARGVPGAHVVMPTAQGLPAESDVFWAAGVAAWYSRARHNTGADVDVTVKKHVRAIKGAAPGLVTYRHETTLRVAPAAPDEWEPE